MANQTGYRVHQWGSDPQRETFSVPSPGKREVLVEVEACGVGLTVLNCVNGNLGNDPGLLPRVPGHELVGRVVGLGDGAESGLLGRRVVAYFYLFCGRCRWCLSGREQTCSYKDGFMGVHRDGGYAPWAVLPERNAIPIPDHLDPIAATVIPDAVATPVHVADLAGINSDDRVVVIGAGGGVGVHMIQVAGDRGATVAGFDVTTQKLAEIERLGAVPVRSDDFEHLEPGVFSGDRATVVIDLIGTAASAGWALASLEPTGTLVVLTTFPDRKAVLESREMVFRELSILGSRYSTRAQVAEAARLVAEGKVQPIVGTVADSKDVLALHEEIRSGSVIGRGALDWS